MNSNKFTFTAEKIGTGYSAYYRPKGGGTIATTGDTVSELKRNALEALNMTLNYQGKKEVTEDNIIIAFDLQQFFKYYNEINVKQLSVRLKMNRGLLSQYINGTKKPSAAQSNKILSGVKSFGRELAEADFV